MLLFPEIFSGSVVGLETPQFATATADQTPAANSILELFNPALTGRAQAAENTAILATLTGFAVWGAQAAAAAVSVFKTTNSAVVAGAPTIASVFLDTRPSGSPIVVATMGSAALPGSGEVFRTAVAASQNVPVFVPFVFDFVPGSGLLLTVGGTARAIITPIWIERNQTF